MKIRTTTAEYTGGGIYIYYGQLEDGHWFLTDDDAESTEILDADPEADEESMYWDWQEAHLVKMLEGDEDREFLAAVLTRIVKDLQAGAVMNASEGEIQSRLDDLSVDAKTYRIEWTGDFFTETIYESDTKADAEKFLRECIEGVEAYEPEEIDCDKYEILWETETRVKVTRYAEDDGEILEFEDWYELVEETTEA